MSSEEIEQTPADDAGEQKSAPRGQGPAGPHGRFGGDKAINFGPSLRRLLGRMREFRVALVVVVVLGALAVALNVVGPKILGRATDVIFAGVIGRRMPAGASREQVIEMLRQQGQDQVADMLSGMDFTPGVGIDFDRLGQIVILVVSLYLISALFAFLQNWLLNRVAQRTIYKLRQELRNKLDKLPLSYFDKQPRGELLSRMTNDIDNIATSLQQTLGQMLSAMLTLLGVGIMMFNVEWRLALITLLIIPTSMVLSGLVAKRAQVQFASMWKRTGELNAQVEEAYTGHSLVKVFGRQREVAEEFEKTNNRLFDAAFRAQFISAMIMPLNFFIGNLNYVVIAVVGGLQVANGRMPIGNIQAFIMYSRMFTQPLTQLASMANLLQSGVASAERVFEVLDAEEMSAEASGALPDEIDGHVEFKDVHFSYRPDQDLIEGLSLEAQPGQTIAIVGPTGAGKTTLVNLLERFYELDDGQILIDGVDIAGVPRRNLRSHLGMVLQDTWLFGGTIRENIAYGKHGATEDEIQAAAKAAFVDRFVHQLPDGYDTVIDEEGNNVSAGEKQLITIARAFIGDPDVLILDEATSSVDTRTEVLVQEAMNQLRGGRTSFVIAHRLSTIRNADLILVMADGDIVEQGNHDELIAARGAYYNLYQSQFQAAME